VDRLVWYEIYDDPVNAITREKELKKWRRDWKIRLIEGTNPNWADLFEGIALILSRVIPGRHRLVASPESITLGRWLWIPGSRARARTPE
jgi:hypothetical protein